MTAFTTRWYNVFNSEKRGNWGLVWASDQPSEVFRALRTAYRAEGWMGSCRKCEFLSNDILDRIDEIVPPGTDVGTLDQAYVPPANVVSPFRISLASSGETEAPTPTANPPEYLRA